MKSVRDLLLEAKQKLSPKEFNYEEIIESNSDQIKPSELIGLPATTAVKLIEQRGLLARIIRQDDVWFVVTAEVNPSRINLEIKNGKIINAAIG